MSDRLLSELAELRAAVAAMLKELGLAHQVTAACETCFAELRSLAAQPQGARGKALLAFKDATTALADYRPSLHDLAGVEPDGGPLTAFWAAYDALAAIDGAQP